MSIKDLFKNKTASFENASTGSNSVESKNLVVTTAKKDQQFIPNIDFSLASNFAKFGSAELYYETSIKRVYNDYPYDGSRNEKLIFELSSSYLDRWIFNNKYPKSTGYVNFSYPSWGSLNGSITSDGYGIPDSIEFIYARGGLHTASAGMESKPLWKTFSDSVKYDSAKDRTTTFVLNLDKLAIKFGNINIVQNGKIFTNYNELEAKEYMKNDTIDINIDISNGSKNFTAYTMDLTKKYIEINADYRS